MKMRVVGCLLCAGVLVLAGACSKKEEPAKPDPAKAAAPQAPALAKVKLALNWVAEPEFGGFYAARESGAYSRAGLDVEILGGGAGVPVVQMVATGQAERGNDLMAAFRVGLLLGCGPRCILCILGPFLRLPSRDGQNVVARLEGQLSPAGQPGAHPRRAAAPAREGDAGRGDAALPGPPHGLSRGPSLRRSGGAASRCRRAGGRARCAGTPSPGRMPASPTRRPG